MMSTYLHFIHFMFPSTAAQLRPTHLIKSDPHVHAVAEEPEAGVRIGCEVVHDLSSEPAQVLLLQPLRQIPVIQCHHRRDAIGHQAVDQGVVVENTSGIELSFSRRKNSAPRYGESIMLYI